MSWLVSFRWSLPFLKTHLGLTPQLNGAVMLRSTVTHRDYQRVHEQTTGIGSKAVHALSGSAGVVLRTAKMTPNPTQSRMA